MAFFTSIISTIIHFIISLILPTQDPPPPPSSSIDSELQAVVVPNAPEQNRSESQAVVVPISPEQNVDSESEADVVLNVAEQTRSESQAVAVPISPEQNVDSESEADVVLNVAEQTRSESQAVAVPIASEQNRKQIMLEWQKGVMAFCFTSALEIAVLFAQTKSQLPVSFNFLSFAILLIFLSLFVANFINHNTTTQVLEMVAVVLVATTVVFTITIPFPLTLKCVTWALYAISLFIVFICRLHF